MKIKLKFFILLLISILGLKGVSKAQLYHVKGTKGVNLCIGYNLKGLGGRVTYLNQFKKRWRFDAGIDFNSMKKGVTKENLVTGNGSILYTITNIKQRLYIEALGGIGLGAEIMKNTINGESNAGFMVKETIGIRNEFCITEKIYINLDVKQDILQLTKNVKGVFEISLGLTINI